jgi:hypothetical protein
MGEFPTTATSYTAGTNPVSVAVGDFDGVNGPDVVVVNSGSGNVSVFLNKGDGTFPTTGVPVYKVGGSPHYVAIADFDGRNGPDIAVPNSANTVGVLLNNGDGTFPTNGGLSYPTSTGTGPTLISVGDFDGKLGPDLAILTTDNGAVAILLNHGDGTFPISGAFEYAATTNPIALGVGDIDGINGPDLVVGTSDKHANIFPNKGDGTFGVTPTAILLPDTPNTLVVSDVDGRNGPDLVTTSQFGVSAMTLLLNRGKGQFGSSIRYAVGYQPSAVAVGDVDGNMEPDVVVTSGDGLSVLLQTTP